MNAAQKLVVSAISLFTVSSSVIVNPAAAAYLTYFGEDQGQGEFTRLSSTPNANLARNDFFSNLVNVGDETFESQANGSSSPINVAFGVDTATITGSGSIATVASGTNGFGRYAISGSKYYEVTGVFTLTFNTAQAAFGFYGVDIGDFDGRVTLTLTKADGGIEVFTVPNTGTQGGGTLYFGLIATTPSEQFTSITFGNTNSGTDVFAFDNFSIGRQEQIRAVPVPSFMAGIVVATGIFGANQIRKRKSRAQ